jgi:RHS repeat-associated protein
MPGSLPAGDADKGTAATSSASPFTAPQLSLPKGGGALRGIDEKFSAQLSRGTGSLTVPIPTSPGRQGFGPQLSIAYDSALGNGPFGLGWSLSVPQITRRTDKNLPRYDDAAESDVFVLSDNEDLVPLLLEDGRGGWREDVFERHGHRVKAYRPRTEGLFARIERWTSLTDGMTHWRSISRDNVLTCYGLDPQSRIANPEDPLKIFSWLVSRSYDSTGNAIIYQYVAEDERGVFLDRPSERHRVRTANRYLKRICYGNREPLLRDPNRPGFRRCELDEHGLHQAHWMFSVVFDYGERHYEAEPADPQGRLLGRARYHCDQPWPARLDPFSSFRCGFEVRTYRLCRHVLMFHHIAEELGVEDCLVTSTAFDYRQQRFGSFLERVNQCGHVLQADGRYLTRSLPPLEMSYTRSPLEDPHPEGFVTQELDPQSLANLPGGVDGSAYRWVDLDGEGIAGVLADQDGAWLYKPNLGNGQLGATETVRHRPTLSDLTRKPRHLMDVTGGGLVNLVDLSVSSPGFYGRAQNARWEGFRAFHSLPVLDWDNPNLRFVDLTGDGVADVLITEDDAFTWHASLLEQGFGRGIRVHIPLDEEESGPRVIFSDPTQSVFIADMTGDGLADLVRIRNGEVCYWPNRGYGRFGAKITLDHSPWFEESDQFDQRRIRLADTDGSGTTDILYLARDGVKIFLNQSGNGLSAPRTLGSFPLTDNVAAVDVADVLGRGTACLLWSSPLPRESGRQLRYIDLMRGQKPYLLSTINNNMGSRTRIEYASSTEFYLADKAAGTAWVTRLPFPVHVVRLVEIYDEVNRNRIVTRYTYHHGFYDGLEREFRGFGRVDQLDTEDLTSLAVEEESTLPPVLTKTWFHTGVFLESGRISRHMAHEYFQGRSAGPSVPMSLPDTVLPTHLTPFEAREACRALKGSILHQEVYALDRSAHQSLPYVVSESNFTVAPVQPKRDNPYAVFFTHARESLTLHYERRAVDPRISHDLTLDVDRYGNVLRSVSIGYRRHAGEAAEQQQTLATLSQIDYTNAVDHPDAYRTPLPTQTSSFQLTAPSIRDASLLEFAAVRELMARAQSIPYEASASQTETQKRLLKRTRVMYRKNDLTTLLPFGHLESLALPGESSQLAFTAGLLEVFRDKATPKELMEILSSSAGGYLSSEGGIWIPSGRVYYARDPEISAEAELVAALKDFFLPQRYRDPFGNNTSVAYDAYKLFPVRTRDAVGNENTARHDYRALQPKELIDPNGNCSEARYDALGSLAGTAIRGKVTEQVGDSFESFVADLTAEQVKRYFDADDPRELAVTSLGTATTRVIRDFTRIPVCTASIARETHVSDLKQGQQTRVQLRFTYWDGFGRQAQMRQQAEPGPLNLDDPHSPAVSPRYVASGAQVYNNKGDSVRQYEPFFSTTPHFGVEKWGVSSILLYDPLQRVIGTLHPNHTYEKVVFDAWQQQSFDVNDTVTFDPTSDPDIGALVRRLPPSDCLPTWYEQRIGGGKGPQEREAAQKAARHADTPTVVHFDTLGRAFLNVADNGVDAQGVRQLYRTRSLLDIQGRLGAVIDAHGRLAMRYDYNMVGAQIRQQNMDAGERWALNDASGTPLRAWNSRGYQFRFEYDPLRRKVHSFVRAEAHRAQTAEHSTREILFEQTIFGDSQATGLSEREQRERNLRGRNYSQRDGAGTVVTERYDFKGNTLSSSRRFTRSYRQAPDWSEPVAVEDQVFVSLTSYDALNRVVEATTPDRSIYRPTFNDASLLQAVDVCLRGSDRGGRPVWSPFVTEINYNPKGQRTLIRYGNGASTGYRYDATTFRLVRLQTQRSRHANDGVSQIFENLGTVQDLEYTYDAIGNLTRVEDGALRRVFFANRRVDPAADFTYDALYRLIGASGREQVGQSAFAFLPRYGNYRDYPFAGVAQPHDLQALRNYMECYQYDPVGNLLAMSHEGGDRKWERAYEYREHSLIEPWKVANRVSCTSLRGDSTTVCEDYRYDAHGSTTQMPHLPRMLWDFADRLHITARQVVHDGAPEATYYVYDAGGQRVRKVTERENGHVKDERLYVGRFEIFREYSSSGSLSLERETLHVMDDQRRIALVETLTTDAGDRIDAPHPLQRYQLANHLGSSTVELDHGGALLSYEEYSPYGNTTFQAARGAAEVSLKRYRYTGRERDEENGFTYHGARYCAPWLGRWISADPAGMVDGSNLYAYARNNPLSLVDPHGTDSGPPQLTPVEQEGGEGVYSDQNFNTLRKGPNYQQATPVDPDVSELTQFSPDMIVVKSLHPKAQTKPKPQPKATPTPPTPPESKPPEQNSSATPPASPSSAGPTTGEKVAAFSEGAAEGLATGIAVDIGVGLVAGATGLAVGTVGLALGAVLLPFAIYEVATHWDDITASADRLVSGNGTLDDFNGLGKVAGGLASLGASGPASELGEELGQTARAAGKDALESLTPKLAPAGGAPGSSLGDSEPMQMNGTGNGGGGGVPKLSAAVKSKLGGLAGRAQEKLADVIRSRGGTGANVQKAGIWAQRTLADTAAAAVAGDATAETAIKIAKQAGRLGEKY